MLSTQRRPYSQQALLRFGAAAFVILSLTGCKKKAEGPNGPSGADPRIVTIMHSGTFDMINEADPQRTPHSYTYRVNWTYSWTDTWGKLFGSGTNSGQVAFTSVTISGTVDATYRDTVDGPNVRCTMTITADPGSPPTFSVAYDSSERVLRITNVEAPTFRYTRTQSSDPKCAGGPGVNIFSPPADWNPLGNGGGTVPQDGGKQDFDKTWAWTHRFASGTPGTPPDARNYVATIHATLDVTVRGQ